MENAGGVPLEQRGAETQCQANLLPAANDDPKFAGKILTSGQDGFYILFAAPDGCKIKVSLAYTITCSIPDKTAAICGLGWGSCLSLFEEWWYIKQDWIQL